jgi:hypothetical protein
MGLKLKPIKTRVSLEGWVGEDYYSTYLFTFLIEKLLNNFLFLYESSLKSRSCWKRCR